MGELARLFLRLGATAFGGPAVHIAMMEDAVVHRLRWLTAEEFLDLVGAAALVPGPNSTELAMHIGRRRAGLAGLIVAGVCFIAPASLIVAVLSWAYVRFGTTPHVTAALAAVAPIVVAVVLHAIWRLAPSALRTTRARVTFAVAVLVLLVPRVAAMPSGGVALQLAVLAGAGLANVAWVRGRALPMLVPFIVPGSGAGAVGAWPVFWYFLGVGAVLYGSGYVLLAFLHAGLVEQRGWLTDRQLLDAVAIGQVTPGPVFTAATFVGYILRGPTGAAVATAGIFLPAFVYVAASAPVVPRLRRSPTAGAFLDGVNVAALALLAVVLVDLARSALTGWGMVAIAAAATLVLMRTRINPAWLFLAGAVIGLLTTRVAAAQDAQDPRQAQPERPTVATHAGTVAPGWVELEMGGQRSESGGELAFQAPLETKIGLVSHVQLSVFTDWQAMSGRGAHQAGLGDAGVGAKWRIVDDAPVFGDFALLPIVTVPTGTGGTSTRTTGLSLLLISSHAIGPVALDVNVGYTHRSGSGTSAPRTSTVWTVSAGAPVIGPLGWALEISGFPGTGDPSGQAPVVALLTGPTFTAFKWLVFDAGFSPTLRGPQSPYVYAGLTWNVGRL